jgi:hypothetical protein
MSDTQQVSRPPSWLRTWLVFEAAAEPLKEFTLIIDAISLILPGGDRGDPRVIEILVIAMVNRATGR